VLLLRILAAIAAPLAPSGIGPTTARCNGSALSIVCGCGRPMPAFLRTKPIAPAPTLLVGTPPDLQELVRKFGGYHKITHEAWAECDAAMAAWQAQRTQKT
jgi:hypothetical protein